MAIIRDKFGNVVTETRKKTLLEIMQDAAGIPQEEHIKADKVNCIKRKIEELEAKAQAKAIAEEQIGQQAGEIDG